MTRKKEKRSAVHPSSTTERRDAQPAAYFVNAYNGGDCFFIAPVNIAYTSFDELRQIEDRIWAIELCTVLLLFILGRHISPCIFIFFFSFTTPCDMLAASTHPHSHEPTGDGEHGGLLDLHSTCHFMFGTYIVVSLVNSPLLC